MQLVGETLARVKLLWEDTDSGGRRRSDTTVEQHTSISEALTARKNSRKRNGLTKDFPRFQHELSKQWKPTPSFQKCI